jgi:hypothetical protein
MALMSEMLDEPEPDNDKLCLAFIESLKSMETLLAMLRNGVAVQERANVLVFHFLQRYMRSGCADRSTAASARG